MIGRFKTMRCSALGLVIGAVVWLLCALPAAAMTEFCMQDGADMKDTFFTAPTTDTTPVRIVMAGVTYSIPRNYFRYPQVECRTGETRGILLRMTLPDFLPATKATWDRLYGRSAGLDDNYIQVLASQQTLRDMAQLLQAFSRFEIPNRTAPPVEGLSSFLEGPLNGEGYPVFDVYFAPNRRQPQIIIYCSPIHLPYDSSCHFLFSHKGFVWSPWTNRKHLMHWRELVSELKAKIDGFIVKTEP